jgi:uncharacterized membrane protein required for colicin V production
MGAKIKILLKTMAFCMEAGTIAKETNAIKIRTIRPMLINKLKKVLNIASAPIFLD